MKAKILIVDDHVLIRKGIRLLLEGLPARLMRCKKRYKPCFGGTLLQDANSVPEKQLRRLMKGEETDYAAHKLIF